MKRKCKQWWARRVWRYQRNNQNPYIEEEQKTQWPKEKYKRTNNELQSIHQFHHYHQNEQSPPTDKHTRTHML